MRRIRQTQEEADGSAASHLRLTRGAVIGPPPCVPTTSTSMHFSEAGTDAFVSWNAAQVYLIFERAVSNAPIRLVALRRRFPRSVLCRTAARQWSTFPAAKRGCTSGKVTTPHLFVPPERSEAGREWIRSGLIGPVQAMYGGCRARRSGPRARLSGRGPRRTLCRTIRGGPP